MSHLATCHTKSSSCKFLAWLTQSSNNEVFIVYCFVSHMIPTSATLQVLFFSSTFDFTRVHVNSEQLYGMEAITSLFVHVLLQNTVQSINPVLKLDQFNKMNPHVIVRQYMECLSWLAMLLHQQSHIQEFVMSITTSLGARWGRK